MSEQQRVVTAVVLCMGILLAWQFFFTPPPPQEEPEAQRTEQDIGPRGAPPPTEAAATGKPAEADENANKPAAEHHEVAESHQAIDTDAFRADVSNREAALVKYELSHYDEAVWVRKDDGKLEQDRSREQPVSLVTAEGDGVPQQARVRLDIDGKTSTVNFAPVEGAKATFDGALANGTAMRVALTPRTNGYGIDYAVTITNGTVTPQTLAPVITLGLEQRGSEGGMFSPAPDQVHALCTVDGSVERKALKDVKDETFTAPAAQWVGIDRQYFLIAVVPQPTQHASGGAANAPGANALGRCSVHSHDKTIWVDYVIGPTQVPAGGTLERTFTLYAGPKRDSDIEAVAPVLKESINYTLWGVPLGFLARPMTFLMGLFHRWTASWGLAIICLTLLVKLLTFPVTYRSVLSMRKMQLLKPELDKIKKQYENDRERQQLEQMKLFREKGVNPVGGCLPMLLQMPIWVALYRMLWSSVDLYHQPFLWIRDLTHPEAFPIMAICVGLLTFVQQRFQPSTVDQAQMKMMMYVMPIMFSVFMFALPSGLVLYMLVNSILTIVQQLAINRRQVA